MLRKMSILILIVLCFTTLFLSACTKTADSVIEPSLPQSPSPPATTTGETASGLPTDPTQTARAVTEAGERWKHVIYGNNGDVILLDIPTDKEYCEYVTAVWDKDANSFIDGWEQIRAAVIEEAEQAYEYDGSTLQSIPRIGFHVTLMNFDMDSESYQSPFD